MFFHYFIQHLFTSTKDLISALIELEDCEQLIQLVNNLNNSCEVCFDNKD